MSRATALARLAAAYGRHELRRRFRRPAAGLARLRANYASDRLLPLTAAERELLPEAAGCINCGLCALVAARVGGLRPPDLASAYLRDYPALGDVRGDWEGSGEPGSEAASALAAAAAACPAGVPLGGVAAIVRRLAST